MIEVRMPTDAPEWAHRFARSLEIALRRNARAQRPRWLPQYASSALPDAALYEGHQIYVSDTNRVAYSDGTNWRYQSDEALV